MPDTTPCLHVRAHVYTHVRMYMYTRVVIEGANAEQTWRGCDGAQLRSKKWQARQVFLMKVMDDYVWVVLGMTRHVPLAVYVLTSHAP